MLKSPGLESKRSVKCTSLQVFFALFVCYTVHVIFFKAKYFLKHPGIFIFSIFSVCYSLFLKSFFYYLGKGDFLVSSYLNVEKELCFRLGVYQLCNGCCDVFE